MQNSTSFISKACDWWLVGLSRPWLSTLASSSVKRTILSYSEDGEFVDQSGQQLDGASLKVLADKTELCLLVPSDLTMSRELSEQQSGVSLAIIAEQLLPFSASELVYVLDSDAQIVHVAVAEELRAAYEALLAHGVRLRGLAFLPQSKADQERLCVTHTLGSLVEGNVADEFLDQETSKYKSNRFRVFVFAFAPLILGLIVNVVSGYWVSEQKHELSKIETAFGELVEGSNNEARSFLSIEALKTRLRLRQAEALSVETLRNDLTSMARNVSESTEVSQLIATPAEIILDASANSGSELQAQLDKSSLFATTEFISSISQSKDGESERFRLKLLRKSEQTPEAR